MPNIQGYSSSSSGSSSSAGATQALSNSSTDGDHSTQPAILVILYTTGAGALFLLGAIVGICWVRRSRRGRAEASAEATIIKAGSQVTEARSHVQLLQLILQTRLADALPKAYLDMLSPQAQPEAATIDFLADTAALRPQLEQQIRQLASLQWHLSAGLAAGGSSDGVPDTGASCGGSPHRSTIHTVPESTMPALATLQSIPNMATSDLYWLVANQMQQVGRCNAETLPVALKACMQVAQYPLTFLSAGLGTWGWCHLIHLISRHLAHSCAPPCRPPPTWTRTAATWPLRSPCSKRWTTCAASWSSWPCMRR